MPNNKEIQEEIKEIYINCPRGSDIHHIFPLNNSKLISGLHVPWNLQYIEKRKHQQMNHVFKSYSEVI